LYGDFNGKIRAFRDICKQSSNGILLEDLVENTEMIVLNSDKKCTGKITWTRGPQSFVIDYVLCSQNMYATTKSLLTDEGHEYSVGSDHNFLIVKAVIPTTMQLPSRKEKSNITKWNIKSDTNWEVFQTAISKSFDGWDSSKYTNVEDMWDDFKTSLLNAGEKSIGYKKYNDKKDYWNKEIDKLIRDRRQANKLYRIWSKHPNCSPELLNVLWDDYLERKKKVADKVKQNVIKQKLKLITENAAKATSNPRAYWNMLRKLNKSSDYPMRIRDPDDPNIIVDDPVIIKDKLTKYWSTLGNSNKVVNDGLVKRLGDLENAAPSSESLHSIKFDDQSIRSAICKLKNGKATGKDSIPGEFLKYGGAVIQTVLLTLFKKINLLEIIPSDWYEGIVKPLFKEGSRESLSNYRGITISSVVYKVLVSIIENQTMTYLEDNNILGDYQGAFRKKRRCEDQIFTLKGICAIRKSKKQNTYLAFLDVSKAFDTVDRVTLFNHIYDKGIQGKAWRLVKMLYNRVDSKVIFGQFESEMFQVQNGVKQGCILSPCLFNLVMEDMENMLKGCEGVKVASQKVNGLFYADDIVLLGSSEQELLCMLTIAETFSKKWGLLFNSKKSQVLIIGKRLSDKQWPLGNLLLAETKTYKYLGVIINRHLKDSDHIISHLTEKAKKLESYIRYTLARHMDIKRITFGDTLWQKAILPSLSHAAGVWFNDTKK
jgi:hypothetical protein